MIILNKPEKKYKIFNLSFEKQVLLNKYTFF